MKNAAAIEQYSQYFEEKLGEVSAIRHALFQKVLLVAILDTLARARSPKTRDNKKRFLALIRQCADWPDAERISLPQLSMLLRDRAALTANLLAREVEKRLDAWEYGRIYRLEKDSRPEDLEHFVHTTEERNLVKNCRHVHRLYTYRCYLVHEFREPGHGMEISDDGNSPYYHGMSDLAGSDTWELVYPVGFFRLLAKRSLFNLKRHLLEFDLDPYSFYQFGSPWR